MFELSKNCKNMNVLQTWIKITQLKHKKNVSCGLFQASENIEIDIDNIQVL